MKKWMKRITLSLLGLGVILSMIVGLIWSNEISTFASIKKIKQRNDSLDAGDVYEMRVKGDFYLDEFVAQQGVKNDKELIQFITNHITKGVIDLTIEESEIACSSFTVKTEAGDYLFARNYDLDKTNSMIVYTEKNGERHSSVSSVDLKFLGIDPNQSELSFKDKMKVLAAPYAPLDGMNDQGVSIGIYMTYQGEKTVATDQNTEKPDMTSTTFIRLVLDYADNLDEAIEIAKQYDLHDSAKTSYHYMIMDKSGRSAILEWVAQNDLNDNDGSKRQLVVTYHDQDQHIGELEGQSDSQWVTNFIVQPNYYENDTLKAGFDRYTLLGQQLQQNHGIVKDDQAAMDLLAMVGRRKGFTGDPDSVTVHSVVYNLSQLKALWVTNEQYDSASSIFGLSLK